MPHNLAFCSTPRLSTEAVDLHLQSLFGAKAPVLGLLDETVVEQKGATGGKRSTRRRAKKRLKQRETVAIVCRDPALGHSQRAGTRAVHTCVAIMPHETRRAPR